MDIRIAQTLYDAVDKSLQATLSTGSAKVMLGLGGLIGSMWLLSFTLRSLHWIWMGMTDIFKDVLWEMLKVAAIAGIAFNVAWYLETIVPFVTNLPVWMGGILSGDTGAQTNQVDTLVNNFINNLMNLINAMDFRWYNVKAIFLAGQSIVYFCVGGLCLILVSVVTLIVLKVTTTIMLALGPLFIAFALFDKTRHWFMNWVSLIAGFMLTNVLFSIVLALEYAFINTVVIKNGVMDTSLSGNIVMLIYFLCFAFMAAQLPSHAAAVMGGSAVSGASMGGLIGKATGLGAAMKFSKLIGNKIS
jgi:type IV secretion system protein VirB6